MDVSAERGPRAVVMSSADRWTSRYQPPSGCGSSRSLVIKACAGSIENRASAPGSLGRLDAIPAPRILSAEPRADRERRDTLAQGGGIDLGHRVVGRVVDVEVDGRIEPGF